MDPEAFGLYLYRRRRRACDAGGYVMSIFNFTFGCFDPYID